MKLSKNKLIDNLAILRSDLLLKRKVCIVGNGGVTIEDEKKIEEADIVIRFNNYATRKGITQARNQRCHMLWTTFDLHSLNIAPRYVVAGIPFPFHAEHIISRCHRWYPDADMMMVNPYWNFMMCKELEIKQDDDHLGWRHPFPSLGFTCLWHLNRMGVFESSKVYICGFNWYFDWSTKLCQGRELTKKDDPAHYNHNYAKEIEWIVKNLLHKMNINYSNSCKQILDYAAYVFTD